jgi:hypothetical protein
MELSTYSRRIAGAALILAGLCLLVLGVSNAEARNKAKVRSAIALGGGPKGKCKKLAASRARSVASRAGRSQARRTYSRVLRRCNNKRAKKVAPPTQVGGGLVVGIDGGYMGWGDTEVEERARLGAAVTRHEWDPLQPVDDQDEVMEEAAGEIHTRIHALLGANQLPDAASYQQWVLEFLGRYGIGGSFWAEHPEYDEGRYAITSIELGNEPYFGDMAVEEYAAAVRPVLEELHRRNLPVTVVLPSRTYGSDTDWMDGLYQLIPNLNELFDAFAEHPYWYGHHPAEDDAAGPFGRIEQARLAMNEHGANTKPIWITEYGQSTADCGEECVSEELQAQHLQEMLSAIVSRPDWGVKMVSVFQLRDRGTNQSDREREFGLLREDGSPKPAYGVVQSAMAAYRG